MSQHNTTDSDDNNDDSDDEEETKPLVASMASTARRQLIALESKWFTPSQQQQPNDEICAPSCFCWFVFIFIFLVIAPVLFFHHPRFFNTSSATKSPVPPPPTEDFRTIVDWSALDATPCAQNLKLSFSKLVSEQPPSFCHDEYSWEEDDHHDSRNNPCPCLDPTQPHARVPSAPHYYPQWDQTFARNQNLARQKLKQQSSARRPSLHTVLLGDSITEHWLGTDLGAEDEPSRDVREAFLETFDPSQVLPMGIAGDRCPQVLYRIQRGILHGDRYAAPPPPAAAPNYSDDNDDTTTTTTTTTAPDPFWKVIWLLIGTNDWMDRCSVSSVLRGQIEIVLMLQHYQPQATVVINSLLPRPDPAGRWNNTRFYRRITRLNQHLECFAEGWDVAVQKERNGGGVEFFNADPYFLEPHKTAVSKELLPDGLHPSGKAARIWGQAMWKRIQELVGEAKNNRDE